MSLLIGIDEAGYGPNLGPLVIACTVWRVPDPETDLDATLAHLISRTPCTGRLVVCDSKAAPGGLAGLERAALSALASLAPDRNCPASWNGLMPWAVSMADDLPAESGLQLEFPWDGSPHSPGRELPAEGPWMPGVDSGDTGLPLVVPRGELEAQAAAWCGLHGASGPALCDVAFSVIWPDQFNRLLDRLGNKSRLLGAATMRVLVHVLCRSGMEAEVDVICDRHGGRQRYLPLLAAAFPDQRWTIRKETADCSCYASDPRPDGGLGPGRPLSIRFEVGGEKHLPVALASMTAKYVRELAMGHWNGYWCGRIEGLRPTAGYPVDAARFRRDLRRHVPESEIPDRVFWRAR